MEKRIKDTDFVTVIKKGNKQPDYILVLECVYYRYSIYRNNLQQGKKCCVIMVIYWRLYKLPLDPKFCFE